jgi:hypothetical protein
MMEEPPPLMEDWRDFVPSALLPAEEARDGMGQIARELPVLPSCDNVMVSPLLSTNNSLKNDNDEEGKKPNGKFNYAI